MKYPFLLTAGAGCYPSAGAGDWIGCFETYEAAEDYFQAKQVKLKNDIYSGSAFDWHEIIDLRDWTNCLKFNDKKTKYN